MSEIEIRIATIADAEQLAVLGKVTFTETFAHLFKDKQDLYTYCDQTFSVTKIKSSLKKELNIYWIAFVDKLPVGYAKLKLLTASKFIISDRVCQLQKIYVLKDYLSMKIGFKLQDLLMRKAAEAACETIWLSVLDRNERAINFYKKNGFGIVGQHDFQIGNEHFEFEVMAKGLKGE